MFPLFLAKPDGVLDLLLGVLLVVFVLLLFAGMAALGLVGGIWSIFGRTGVIFERASGTVTVWWGVAGLRRRYAHRLSDYKRVVVVPFSGNKGGTLYTVFLVGSKKPLGVVSIGSRTQISVAARAISNFLKGPSKKNRPGAPDTAVAEINLKRLAPRPKAVRAGAYYSKAVRACMVVIGLSAVLWQWTRATAPIIVAVAFIGLALFIVNYRKWQLGNCPHCHNPLPWREVGRGRIVCHWCGKWIAPQDLADD